MRHIKFEEHLLSPRSLRVPEHLNSLAEALAGKRNKGNSEIRKYGDRREVSSYFLFAIKNYRNVPSVPRFPPRFPSRFLSAAPDAEVKIIVRRK